MNFFIPSIQTWENLYYQKLFDTVSNSLFYSTAATTTIDLVEEIIIVLVLREWKTNVKGLYWVLRMGKA